MDIHGKYRIIAYPVSYDTNLTDKWLDGKLSDNGVPHKDLIEAFCVRVTPQENGVYKWYLNFGEELSIDRPFDEKEYHLIDRFCIDFDTARDYRKRHGSFMRRNAWEDLHTEVYLHFGKAE